VQETYFLKKMRKKHTYLSLKIPEETSFLKGKYHVEVQETYVPFPEKSSLLNGKHLEEVKETHIFL
jgi:hypothetical protein